MTLVVEYTAAEDSLNKLLDHVSDTWIGTALYLRRTRRLLGLSLLVESRALLLLHRFLLYNEAQNWPTDLIRTHPDFVRSKSSYDAELIRNDHKLRITGVACLLIGAKLTEQRRLISQMVEKAITQQALDELNKPANPVVFTASVSERVKRQSKMWSEEVFKTEQEVLIRLGFMVFKCTEPPQRYIRPIMDVILGEDVISDLDEIERRATILLTDLTTLPLVGLIVTDFIAACSAITAAIQDIHGLEIDLGPLVAEQKSPLVDEETSRSQMNDLVKIYRKF